MEKDKKKIIAGVGVLTGTIIVSALLRRKPPEEPPPPGEDYGRVQGHVLDGETSAKIMNAEILVDDIYHCSTESHGIYRTHWIPFGSHTITVKASNYEIATFSILLEETLMDQDLLLQPLPEAPTEWTEGVEIEKIKVTPSKVYLGESVEILVNIQYPDPLPLPADIHGTILVDGVELTGERTIDFRNPSLLFTYTPSQIGDYVVRAQDKSANFEVIQDITSTYYPPFGGTRIPLCTEITIPNVPPSGGFVGGDYKVQGRSNFLVQTGLGFFGGVEIPENLLPLAYPSAWDPPAVIRKWAIHTSLSLALPSGVKYFSITVMATDYDCPPYWNSKDELAQAIAGYGGVSIPNEWIPEYGTICPICNGTGKTNICDACRGTGKMIDVDPNVDCMKCRGTGFNLIEHLILPPPSDNDGVYYYLTCWNCDGLGKVLTVSLQHGWRDQVKEIMGGTLCGGGYCTFHIYCPYCGEKITGPSYTQGRSWDKLSFIRTFLSHIEGAHPNHPLTEPAWF